MRRTVGKALVAGTAAVMVAVVVPAASASAGGDTIRGGCYAYGVPTGLATPGQNTGAIGDLSGTSDASGLPTGGTVTCTLVVNGLPMWTFTYSGAGAEAGMNTVTYTASPTDDVEVCQSVRYADDTTDGESCKPISQAPVPPEVGDLDAAYCPYGSITGTGTWTPPETATLAPHVFVWDTNATCTGTADDGGFYHVTFTGSANDACTAGTGAGTLSGTGPEGPISGSFTFYRGGIHLYISGTFVSGGEQHNLQYWLDVLASTDGVCSYSTAPLIGHGAIWDSLSA